MVANTEGLLAFLRRDLDEGLRSGMAADPARGALWLLVMAILIGSMGVLLFIDGGYHTGFSTLNAWTTHWPPWLWQNLTLLGDEHFAFALSLFFARRHPRLFWALICAAVVAAIYARGLKPLVDAARPPAVLAEGSYQLIGPALRSKSFPSGHSVTAGLFFGVLIYHARLIEWRLFFALLALLSGLSRVALGVHWPVDVAAGLTGGLLAALIGIWLARRTPWVITDASVHLALVTLAAIMAVALMLAGSGYPDALWAGRLVAAGGLMFGLVDYWLLPLYRYLSSG